MCVNVIKLMQQSAALKKALVALGLNFQWFLLKVVGRVFFLDDRGL